MKRANVVAELVFHGLAFVPVSRSASDAARAASLSWPAYTAFAGRVMPLACAPFAEDAPLLSRLLEPVEVAHGIGWLAELFDDLEALVSCAGESLAGLDRDRVASSAALDALRRLPVEPVEIMRADLALAARPFGEAYASLLSPHSQKFLEALSACLGDDTRFAGREVIEAAHFATTLGPRGRGFPARTYVGSASLPGEDALDTGSPLVLAAHEAAVHAAARALSKAGVHPTWGTVEPVALEAARDWLSATPLSPAHAAWSASLDRSGLAELSPPLRAAAAEATAILRGTCLTSS